MLLARIAVIFVIGISAVPARADDATERARVLVEAADKEFKLGHFTDALAGYTSAYAAFPAAPLLFNIAQCHRYLKDFEKAVFSFESYLRASPAAPNRAVVLELIRDSKAELEKQRLEAARRVEDEARQKGAAEAQRRAEEQRARQRAEEQQRLERARQLEEERQRKLAIEAERRDRDRWYRKWWVWSAIGGAALAAGGTAYYFSGSTTVVLPSGSVGGLDRR